MKTVCIFLLLSRALSAQTITTVVGSGEPGFGGDGGSALMALLNGQGTLALDARGNLYLNDDINNRIRKVTQSGIITTVIGNGEISSAIEGAATQTGFLSIYDFATLPDGTIYVGDADGLKKVDIAGNLTFVVTGGSVTGIKISKQGVFYIGNITAISRLNSDGSQTVVAGSENGDPGDGGLAANAAFYVTTFTTDLIGDIYILDGTVNKVRKFTPGGAISTVAGNGTDDFSGDGRPAAQAQLSKPFGLAVDVAGNIYISDTGNRRIRRVTTDGIINTFAGTGDGSLSGDGGPALQATFNFPAFLAVNCNALYISDTNTVRAIALTDPLIAMRGVTSLTTGALTLRAGTNFQISGCNLANIVADGGSSLSLAGTTVSMNGVQVPVVSVSPTQVTATLPFGFPSGATVVKVARDGIVATAAAATVVE